MSKIALFRKKSFRIVTLLSLLFGVVAFAVDSDNDGMSDLYEVFFKLNPFNGSDAVLHDDSDELNNLAESERWTDPFSPDTDMDGWADDVDSNALSRAVFMWGHPDFVDGDSYSYTGPVWMEGAEKSGGSWTPEAWAIVPGEVAASLVISVDRTNLNANCVMDMWFDDTVDSTVQLQLLNADGSVAVTNLVADLTDGTATQQFKRVAIPFVAYSEVSKVAVNVLQADNGFALYSSTLYVDEDADGLDSDQEAQLGTSDQLADTDEDGLSDFEEAMVTGTDPMDADADGDGLLDAAEIENGTDPSMTDSDGDGLSDWFELVGFRYHVVTNALSWNNAKAAAEVCGGHLVTISSQEEHDLIIEFVGTDIFSVKCVWIGASDAENEGDWRWVDGTSVEFNLWNQGSESEAAQPDNNYNLEDWAAYGILPEGADSSALTWFDFGVAEKAAYIVERDTPLDPNNPDMDNDGLSDGLEIELGSNPWSAESDGDGLLDYSEYTGSTHPAKADTDDDGLSDSEEMQKGTEPLVADTDGDGLSDGYELKGFRYQVVTDHLLTWDEAVVAAQVRGGHLATIKSQEEHDLMVETVGMLSFYQEHSIWIGATDVEEEGYWKWADGEPVEFTLWDQEWSGVPQPDNLYANQHWAAYGCWFWDPNYTELAWFDFWPHAELGYLIEREVAMDPFNPDMDGDGLNDGLEIELGSNPWSAESDGDGIPDLAEYNGNTHPGKADTDGDGLNDDVEPGLGLDPANPDCDGDGLADGYEMLYSQYELIPDSSSWQEAKIAAELRGGQLVSIASSNEHAVVVKSVTPYQVAHFHPWISATYEPVSASWSWGSGEPWNYELWDREDRRYKPLEPGWAFYSWNRMWRTSDDDHYNGYIVEYPQHLDPFNPDFDGDGVLDGDEVEHGSSPYVADTDGDGINDSEEISAGLNPKDADSDRDGIADNTEISSATDALSSDTDGDGLLDGEEIDITLTDPLQADSTGTGIRDSYLVQSLPGANVSDWFANFYWNTWKTSGESVVLSRTINRSASVTYKLSVADPGMHRLVLQASWPADVPPETHEPRVELYIDGNLVSRNRAVLDDAGLPDYAFITPWLVAGEHEVKFVLYATAYQREATIRLDAVELYGIDGADADGDGIQDWMKERMNSGEDSDKDGLSDLDELLLYGSDPLSNDTDDDGLSDSAEIVYGTDILDADSDGDGVSDGEEVLESLSNPLGGDFDATFIDTVVLPGSQFANATENVAVKGSMARMAPRRGYLEYHVNITEADVYRLRVTAAHGWLNSLAPDASRLEFYVDGLYVGRKELETDSRVMAEKTHFMPWLDEGEHVIGINWDNYDPTSELLIEQVCLQQAGGPDSDGNGLKDWVECYLDQIAGIDSMPESYVSPACIEGDARFVPFMQIGDESITNEIVAGQAVGNRWFADLPLNEVQETIIPVSFQNGGKEQYTSTTWVPFNLVEHDSEAFVIRKGDSMQFAVIPEGISGGQFNVTVFGEEYRCPDLKPLMCCFNEAGTNTVSGTFTHGSSTISASVEIVVIDGGFPETNPACIPGRPRLWSCPDLPLETVVEYDPTIEMSDVTADGASERTFMIEASRTLGEHWLVSRLYEGGPILDNIRIDTCWSSSAPEGGSRYVGTSGDMQVYEFVILARDLPPGVTIEIESIVAGVVFADDFSTKRILTADDFNDQGEYVYRLAVPVGVNTATCHSLRMYQDGEYIGGVYSSGALVPGT